MARKDSDASEDEQDNYERPRKIAKTVTMAIALFLAGSLLLYFGITDLNRDKDRAIAMIVLGSLTFIPGSYATWMLFGAWYGLDGYTYDSIPSYDD